jgi:hypothetical protein
MIARETIYTALFALVTAAPGLKKTSRRLIAWEEVAPADQPALFMVQRTEMAKVVTRLPTVWTLKVDLVLYGNNSAQDSVAPMSLLNPIVDYIVAAMLPPIVPYEQTLGGLVERCRIDGEIITDEGVLGNQAVVVIPVEIFVPQ